MFSVCLLVVGTSSPVPATPRGEKLVARKIDKRSHTKKSQLKQRRTRKPKRRGHLKQRGKSVRLSDALFRGRSRRGVSRNKRASKLRHHSAAIKALISGDAAQEEQRGAAKKKTGKRGAKESAQAAVSLGKPLEEQNLFLPAKARGLGAAVIPDKLVEQTHEAMEAALGSVFERMTIPVMTADGKGPQRNVRLFEYLEQHLETQEVKILPSGGVVRSALAYLQGRIHGELVKDPRRAPLEILRHIAYKEHGEISGWDIKGNGSDFDLLLKGPDDKVASARKQILEVINSVETGHELTADRSHVKRHLLFVGDVKGYKEQIDTATSQGGVTLDFLAYDLSRRQMLEPAGMSGILTDLIRGRLSYIAPKQGSKRAPPQKQVVRGIRPLFEFPFARYGNPKRFLKELNELKREIDAGGALEEATTAQVAKSVCNAQMAGVNRVFKPDADKVERTIAELNVTIKAATNSRYYIPSFVPVRPIEGRDSSRREIGDLPRSWLMSLDTFIEQHTAGGAGVLWHGTPNVDFALAINRQGLIVSSEKQGMAGLGFGGYMTRSLSVAQGYAQQQGVVLNQQVKRDPRLNILDWTRVDQGSPMVKTLKERAQRAGMELFEYIARAHHVDLIVADKDVVLLQNMSALERRFGVKEILEIQTQSIRNNRLTYTERVKHLLANQSLIDYGRSMGLDKELGPLSVPRFMGKLQGAYLRTRSPGKRRDILDAFYHASEGGISDAAMVRPVAISLRSGDLDTLLVAAQIGVKLEPRAQQKIMADKKLATWLQAEGRRLHSGSDLKRLKKVTRLAGYAAQMGPVNREIRSILQLAAEHDDMSLVRLATEAALSSKALARSLRRSKPWLRALQRQHRGWVKAFKRTRSVSRRLALLESIAQLHSFPIAVEGSADIFGRALWSTRREIREEAMRQLDHEAVQARLIATQDPKKLLKMASRLLSLGNSGCTLGFSLLRRAGLVHKISSSALRGYQDSPEGYLRWEASRLLTERGKADHLTLAILENLLPPRFALEGEGGQELLKYYKKTGLYQLCEAARAQVKKLPPASGEMQQKINKIRRAIPVMI